jgi:glucuronosyltransferase
LEEFVGARSAPHGFIYISFGTVLNGTTMPNSTRKKFVNVFSQLKQKVVWKWESESMEEDAVPENIILKKWLPQQDILGIYIRKAPFN